MATRRKYKVPAYKDGGAVRVDNIIVAPPVEAPVQVEHCSTSGRPPVEAAPPPADDDPLVKAHRAQQRAEEIQRNAARAPQGNANRPPSIDDVVNAIPGLSEHKRQFRKANSNLLQPANVDAVRFHYHAALNAGVVDDTPEMNQAILDGIARERARAVAQAKAIVEPPAPAAPSRPRVQVSAPVSREAPAMSGNRQPSDWNTLSPEERDMAHRSFVDRPDMPRLTLAEREYLYLQNRNKYRKMKASGEYSERRE